MPYCNQADIEGEIQNSDLIALTDDTQTGNINSTILNQVISNASSYIDSLVSNIYTTPFADPVPSTVKSMAITIVCYRLLRRRLVPDEKNNFYDEFVSVNEFLKQVNIGEQHISQAPARTFPQGAVNSRPTVYGNNTFGLANSM